MKAFEVGDKVKIIDCNTDKMIGAEGTIVYVNTKCDINPYLLRISTDKYKDIGWRIEDGYGCSCFPYGLVADYEDDDRYTFWWVSPSEIALVEDDEGEEKEMKEFHTNDRVYHTNFSSKGTIVYIDEGGIAPYLVRFDEDVLDGWLMSNNRNNFMQVPQKLYDTYKSNNDYCFWWATASSLEHIKDEETTTNNEKMRHDIQKQLDGIIDKVGIAVGVDEDTKYHDTHYKSCAIEPIEAMQVLLSKEQFKGFLLGNALKYRLRAGHKDNALSDVDKAVRYEQWLKEFEEKGVITL